MAVATDSNGNCIIAGVRAEPFFPPLLTASNEILESKPIKQFHSSCSKKNTIGQNLNTYGTSAFAPGHAPLRSLLNSGASWKSVCSKGACCRDIFVLIRAAVITV